MEVFDDGSFLVGKFEEQSDEALFLSGRTVGKVVLDGKGSLSRTKAERDQVVVRNKKGDRLKEITSRNTKDWKQAQININKAIVNILEIIVSSFR